MMMEMIAMMMLIRTTSFSYSICMGHRVDAAGEVEGRVVHDREAGGRSDRELVPEVVEGQAGAAAVGGDDVERGGVGIAQHLHDERRADSRHTSDRSRSVSSLPSGHAEPDPMRQMASHTHSCSPKSGFQTATRTPPRPRTTLAALLRLQRGPGLLVGLDRAVDRVNDLRTQLARAPRRVCVMPVRTPPTPLLGGVGWYFLANSRPTSSVPHGAAPSLSAAMRPSTSVHFVGEVTADARQPPGRVRAPRWG